MFYVFLNIRRTKFSRSERRGAGARLSTRLSAQGSQRVPLQAIMRSCRRSTCSCKLPTHSCTLSTCSCRLSASLCRLGSQHIHAGCQRVHAGCQRVMQTASSGFVSTPSFFAVHELDRSCSPTMVNILLVY